MTEQQTPDREKKIAEIREALEVIKRYDLSTLDNIMMPVYNFCVNAPEWLRFLLSERDAWKRQAVYWQQEERRVRLKLQSAQQEIKRLEQERDKMIEGLRKLAKTNAENISEIREWKAKQNDPEVIDLDWYNYVARNILKEIGVTADV